MTQALYRKWRPRLWDEVVGQQHVIKTLRNAVTGERVAHAYLFSGPRGTGKTTVARLLAKAVNCLEPELGDRPCNQCAHCQAVNENRFLDLIEIDAASNTSVENVRDLRDKINFSPSQGRYKIYIIDEVHMLSTAAFNALLKTLEEPPPHAMFVLATTEIHKIPPTVLSRCQRHEFRRIPVIDIVDRLNEMLANEEIAADKDAITMIARQSTGSLRDAISLLDQLASSGETITLPLVQTVLGSATNQTVITLVETILKGNPASGLESIHAALDAGTDPRTLSRQIVEYLRALLLIKLGNDDQVDAPKDIRKQMEAHASAIPMKDVLHMVNAFNQVATDLHGGWQPALGLELALAEVIESKDRVASDISKEPDSGPAPPAVREAVSKKKSVSKPVADEPVKDAPEKKPGTEPAKTASPTSLNAVVKAWKQIREVIRPEHPSVDGLLNSCNPMEVTGKVLVLGFQTEVVRSKMDKPEQIEIARRAIQRVLGVELDIRCVVADAKAKTPPNIDQNGMVAAALQQGGEIVDVQ